MRTSRISLIAAFVTLTAGPRVCEAQDFSELVAAGRFEEAAASLAGAGPQEAEAGATLIFDQAYTSGYQAQRYDYATRGFAAARNVPGLSAEMIEQLNFWHGLSLFQSTVPLSRSQDLAAARTSLPGFQEAQALLGQVGDYPSRVGVDMATTMRALGTFIEIQEAIIRRGY